MNIQTADFVTKKFFCTLSGVTIWNIRSSKRLYIFVSGHVYSNGVVIQGLFFFKKSLQSFSLFLCPAKPEQEDCKKITRENLNKKNRNLHFFLPL